jgi:hypothetical protein
MSRSVCSAGIVVVATLLALPSIAQSAASGDACSLLTKADAAAALGEAAAAGKQIPAMSDGAGGTVSTCGYAGSSNHKIQLDLTRPPASSLSMFTAMCADKAKDGLGGLGDVACWYDDKHAELHVIKGAAVLSITLQRSGNTTEPIIAVMKKALAKLK